MTLGQSRSFFRSTLNALKLKEWTDGFVVENIPATLLDGSYHLSPGHINIKTAGVQGSAFEVVCPIKLRVFSKGFKNPAAAIDGALDLGQKILGAFVSANKTLDEQGIKRVLPTGLDTQPLQVSNTHAVIMTMTFDTHMILGF